MKTKRTLYLAEIAILSAVILLMAFTPIGYLRLPMIEITFITIPVVLGAIVIGPAAGAILGMIFGLTSFIQCFGMSVFGAALLAINPFFTFILCVIPRILVGFLSGLIFKAFKAKNIASFLTASLSGPIINTLLFVVTLILLFGSTTFILEMQGDSNLLAFLVAFVGINGLIEAAACGIICTFISRIVYKANSRRM